MHLSVQTGPRLPFEIPAVGDRFRRVLLKHSEQPDAVQILGVLNRLADDYSQHPLVRKWVAVASGSILPGNPNTLLTVLWRMVLENVRYLPDPDGIEFVKTPDIIIAEVGTDGWSFGDCDDQALLLCSTLKSAGIPARVAAAKINGSSYFNHVFCQVQTGDGQWRQLETCVRHDRVPRYDDILVVD